MPKKPTTPSEAATPPRKKPAASTTTQRSTLVRASPRSTMDVPKTLGISVVAELVKDALIAPHKSRMD